MNEIELLQQRVQMLENIINSFFFSSKFELRKNLNLGDGINVYIGTNTGTKIGTTTTQKIGFYNATPIVQPPSAGNNSAPVQNSGTTINYNSTFDGWTVVRLVRALRELGLLT